MLCKLRLTFTFANIFVYTQRQTRLHPQNIQLSITFKAHSDLSSFGEFNCRVLTARHRALNRRARSLRATCKDPRYICIWKQQEWGPRKDYYLNTCLDFSFAHVSGCFMLLLHISLLRWLQQKMVLRDDSVSFANCGYLSLVTHFILEENEESLIALVSTKLQDYFFIFLFYFALHISDSQKCHRGIRFLAVLQHRKKCRHKTILFSFCLECAVRLFLHCIMKSEELAS